MKKKIIIITSFEKNFGYGNLNRSYNFYNYIKKKIGSSKIYVKTSFKNFFLLKKKYKNIHFFKLSSLEKDKKYLNSFIDCTNLKKNQVTKIKKIFKFTFFYGDNNYFLFNKFKFLPFKKKNIHCAIIDSSLREAQYFSSKKIVFFLYFSTHFNKKLVIKLIQNIRKVFANKIKLFANKKTEYFNRFKNLEVTEKLFRLKKNYIYISNSGSGVIDRLNKGYISINFSKTKNEKEFALNLKKINKSFYYIGDVKSINYHSFLLYLKKIKNYRYPYKSNNIGYFNNNNKNLIKKIF
jgi:hypothetical protein